MGNPHSRQVVNQDETPKNRYGKYKELNSSASLRVIRRLLRISRPEFWRLVIGYLALLGNSLTNLSFPWMMGKALDQSSSDLVEGRDFKHFFMKAAAILCLGSVSSCLRVYFLGISTERIRSRLCKLLYNSYMEKDLKYFELKSSLAGEVISTFEIDTKKSSELLTDKIASGLRSFNSAINGSILLFSVSPKLYMYSLGVVPVVGILAMTFAKISKSYEKKLLAIQSDLYGYAMERIDAISTVKLNCKEEYEKRSYEVRAGAMNNTARDALFSQGLFMSFLNISTNTSLLVILLVGGRMIGRKELTPGQLTRFAMQSVFVGLGFSGLASFYADLTRSIEATDRIFTIIDEADGAQENSASTPASSSHVTSGVSRDGVDMSSASTASLLSLTTALEDITDGPSGTPADSGVVVDGVFFSYPSRPDTPVLVNMSVVVPGGSFVVFVGRSGAGKSTLCKLLSGLQRPSSGRIIVDGEDVGSLSKHALLSKVGVVEQQAGLLNGTIEYNIQYGVVADLYPRSSSSKYLTTHARGGRDSEEERTVVSAAKRAGLHEFVESLQGGYLTQVGVGGKLLSGGQKARVAIARALIREPSLLILDEATAALDGETEREVIESLKQLRSNQTIIAFSHSEAMMRAADVIHVIDGGRVQESGSYEQLLDIGGAFANALLETNRHHLHPSQPASQHRGGDSKSLSNGFLTNKESQIGKAGNNMDSQGVVGVANNGPVNSREASIDDIGKLSSNKSLRRTATWKQ